VQGKKKATSSGGKIWAAGANEGQRGAQVVEKKGSRNKKSQYSVGKSPKKQKKSTAYRQFYMSKNLVQPIKETFKVLA